MESNENSLSEQKNRRLRGENWTQEEKDLFIEIMRQSAPIVENKSTDTNTNKRKYLEWLKIQKKLKELTGKRRDIPQLKGFWRRTKIAAKKTMLQHKKSLDVPCGGHHPPSPQRDTEKNEGLYPADYVKVENTYDSDSEANASIEIKKHTKLLVEEEHVLKIMYHRQELEHQKSRHKLELEILMLEKEKKQLELQALKGTLL